MAGTEFLPTIMCKIEVMKRLIWQRVYITLTENSALCPGAFWSPNYDRGFHNIAIHFFKRNVSSTNFGSQTSWPMCKGFLILRDEHFFASGNMINSETWWKQLLHPQKCTYVVKSKCIFCYFVETWKLRGLKKIGFSHLAMYCFTCEIFPPCLTRQRLSDMLARG